MLWKLALAGSIFFLSSVFMVFHDRGPQNWPVNGYRGLYRMSPGRFVLRNVLFDLAGDERQGDESFGPAGGLPGLSAFSSGGAQVSMLLICLVCCSKGLGIDVHGFCFCFTVGHMRLLGVAGGRLGQARAV